MRPPELLELVADPPPWGKPPQALALRPGPDRRVTFVTGEGESLALWETAGGFAERKLLLDARSCADHGIPLKALSEYLWKPDGERLLFFHEGSCWIYLPRPLNSVGFRLISDCDPEVMPHPAPDGWRVAFVRDGDLWLKCLRTGEEIRLTADGSEAVLNGKLDWVHWEELNHRAGYRAFEWSPDGSRIALLRFDQTAVPTHPLVDFRPDHATLRLQRYPQPGDPNAVVELRVLDAETGEVLAAAGSDPAEGTLCPDLTWTPDGEAVLFRRLDRRQRNLRLCRLDRSGETELARDRAEDWVNAFGPPLAAPDGRVFRISEADGAARVWCAAPDGDWEPLTPPELQVQSLHALLGDRLLFSAIGPDPRQSGVWELALPDRSMALVSEPEGTARATWDPRGLLVVEQRTADRPPTLTLRFADGECWREWWVPEDGWRNISWAPSRWEEVPGPGGEPLMGRLVLPPGFSEDRRYPAVVHVYGGPHAQRVRWSWGGEEVLDQLLAAAGFVVWSLDNRGSWGRGHDFEAPLAGRLGRVELEDQLDGLEWLAARGVVDTTRVGITGWSYGGFLTLYALCSAPGVFACGVAGAPVTDWVLYDSLYTERYLGLPAENADGYRNSSPVHLAEQLSSPLLLVHGTDDDNVHMQHTLRMADALNRLRKPYEMLLQPGEKHGFRSREARIAVNERIVEFFRRHLLG